MKIKAIIAILVLVLCAGATPAALAENYTFTFTGPITNGPTGTISLAGVFTTTGAPNADGGMAITSFTGTYADHQDGVVGTISQYPGVASYENYLTSSDGSWLYDNLFYPHQNAPGTTNGQFDYYGLLWYVGPVSDPHEWEVNFWSNTSTTYTLEESAAGQTQNYLNSASGAGITRDHPVIAAPEPASPVAFLAGIAVLAFAAVRRRRMAID